MATMVTPLFLYFLLTLALVAVAIYEHITATALSLPIPAALTILTILLPLLPPLTTFTTPYLLRYTKPNRNRSARISKHTTTTTPLPLSAILLNLFPLLLTTTLLTLHSTPLTLPPSVRTCILTQKWQALYSSHNAPAIRAIQDALECCGLRSTRDMSWPFPSRGNGGDKGGCEVQFGRGEACLNKWEGELRRLGGVGIGVVGVVGVVQVLVLVLTLRDMGFGNSYGGWWRVVRERLLGFSGAREEGVVEEGIRRPLLAAADADEVGEHEVGRGYDQEGRVEEEDGGEEEQVEQMVRPGNYGGAGGGGPRVEPSHHDPWAGVGRV